MEVKLARHMRNDIDSTLTLHQRGEAVENSKDKREEDKKNTPHISFTNGCVLYCHPVAVVVY